MLILFKTVLSAILLVAVSEVAKRSGSLGGLIASLPVVSILALSWLYWDTHDAGKVARLSTGIFWMVLPSLVLFLILPELLKRHMAYIPALLIACGVTVLAYVFANWLYSRVGIST